MTFKIFFSGKETLTDTDVKHVYDKNPKKTTSIEKKSRKNPMIGPSIGELLFLMMVFLIPLSTFLGRNTKYGRIISSKIFGTKNSFQTFESYVTFDDVKGCDEAKFELEQNVEFLRNPWKFSKFGGRLSKGVLLHGPPGTGKKNFLLKMGCDNYGNKGCGVFKRGIQN